MLTFGRTCPLYGRGATLRALEEHRNPKASLRTILTGKHANEFPLDTPCPAAMIGVT